MCNNTSLWLKLSFVANHSTKISLSCIKLPKGWRFVNNSTVFKSELANSRGGETPKVTFKVSLHHSETFPSSTAYGLAWHDCFWEIHARPPHLHPIQTVLPYKYANTRIRFIKLESMISFTLLYTSLPYCYGTYQPVVRDFIVKRGKLNQRWLWVKKSNYTNIKQHNVITHPYSDMNMFS